MLAICVYLIEQQLDFKGKYTQEETNTRNFNVQTDDLKWWLLMTDPHWQQHTAVYLDRAQLFALIQTTLFLSLILDKH